MSHVLIAIATSQYSNLATDDQRPQLEDVRSQVVSFFTRTLGCYETALDDISLNPRSDALRRELDSWFAADERDPSDWVVLYYTGHAELSGADALYLLTSDYEKYQYVGTAFRLDQLADIILSPRSALATRGVANILFIVDACFAGAGATQLMEKISKAFHTMSRGKFHCLAAALPREEALAGALTSALIAAVDEISTRYVTQRYLFFEQIHPEINRRLRVQRAIYSAADAGLVEAQFFPNPNFVERAEGRVVPADEARQAILDAEFRTHWDPRARGVAFEGEAGTYFSGRTAVLERLENFLSAPDRSGACVVTGKAGAGKSAILARMVTDPSHIVDLAIHARGKRLSDFVDRFSRHLSVASDVTSVIGALRLAGQTTRVVVDGLDEAAEPAAIAVELLQPLSALGACRIIVGTREQHAGVVGASEIIDIDEPPYADFDDIRRYVLRRLTEAPTQQKGAPYASDADRADEVARAVASRTYPNFLTARLVSDTIRTVPMGVDAATVATMPFPSTVDDAFREYLDRFGADARRVRDLFAPLAFALGPGLPWDNVWAPLASALAGRAYNDDDVRWALEHAGAFVLESSEDGRAAFRLYHEALAEYIRREHDAERANETFVRVLTGAVPVTAGTSQPDWSLASRYARALLPEHAARGGMLGDILSPGFLLAADPTRLLSVLARYPAQVPPGLADSYRAVVHHLRAGRVVDAASYLEFAFRQWSMDGLADVLSETPVLRRWSVPWARWEPRPQPYAIAVGSNAITALATAPWERGTPVALVGRDDGSVEVWDIERGRRLLAWNAVDGAHVKAVTVAHIDGVPFVVAAWSNGTIGVADSAGSTLTIRKEPAGSEAAARAFALLPSGDAPRLLVAHADRNLAMYSLPGLARLPNHATVDGCVYFLEPVAYRGSMAILVGRDSLTDGRRISPLMLLSGDDLHEVWRDERLPSGVNIFGEVFEYGGRSMVLVSQDMWGPPEIWDIDDGRIAFCGDEATTRSWLRFHANDALLVNVSGATNWLSAARLTFRDDKPLVLGAHDDHSVVPIWGSLFSKALTLGDRTVILSADTGTVFVWDVDELIAARQPVAELKMGAGAVTSVAVRPDGEEAYACTAAGVIALDPRTGVLRWKRNLGADGVAARVVAALPDGTGIVIAPRRPSTQDELLVLAEPYDSSEARSIPTGASLISRMKVIRYENRAVAALTVRHGREWRVRFFDLENGTELSRDNEYALRGGEEDKELVGLAVWNSGRRLYFAFASKYGKVMFASLTPTERSRSPYVERFLPHAFEGYVDALAAGPISGEIRVVSGTRKGELSIWRLGQHEEVIVDRPDAHLAQIESISVFEVDGEAVIASGSRDGSVRLWDAELNELLAIELGAPVNEIAQISRDTFAVATALGIAAIRFDVSAVVRKPSRREGETLATGQRPDHGTSF